MASKPPGSELPIRSRKRERPACSLRSDRERGSALLIVLVFAAIVAIMLYKALPDAYFEAQRQKEQLLIDRGNQYKTAIKRFVTKNRIYPTSLDQLDNFNGVRYLRHRYKDPMTGKSEWRLIHVMGPGFVLTDSKVTPLNSNGTAGQNGAAAPNANPQGGFASTPSTFGSNNSATNSSSFGNTNTFGQPTSSSSNQSQQNGTDPNTPPAPTAAQLYGARRRPSALPATMDGQQNDDNSGQPDGEKPLAEPGMPEAQQTQNGAQGPGPPPGLGAGPAGNAGVAASGAPTGDPNNPAANALNAVNNQLRQQQPTPTAATSAGGTGPTILNGAIAGVASTAKGSSIKVIDKQTDYSKWEFVYNPQKDAANQIQNALGNNNPNGQNPNGTAGFGPNSSGSPGFGSSPGGFGSPSGSAFGNNNSPTTNTPTPANQ